MKIVRSSNRIDRKFSELKRRGKKALIVFITAGDPNLKKTEALIYAFEREGVDLIELGVPFSDPLADGPVIQAASNRSLKEHTTLRKILALVGRVRKKSDIPILFMSYLNPILAMGANRFAEAARRAGLDGVIIPDLPPDEEKEVRTQIRKKGVEIVYLLSPTSTPKRRRMIARASSGFIYYVSLTGVTGLRNSLPADMKKNILKIKEDTRLPVCVGFGVSKPVQADGIARYADGVIIGSVLVQALSKHAHENAGKFAKKFVTPFVKAVKRGG